MAEPLGNNVVTLLERRFPSEVTKTHPELEIEAGKLLDRLGLIEKAAQIPEGNSEIVAAGIADLWAIKLIGDRTEKSDREIVGGVILEDNPQNPSMRAVVEKALADVSTESWFGNSVTSLVEAGLARDGANQSHLVDWVVLGPDRYVRALEGAGEEYKKHQTAVSWSKEGAGVVENYLDSVRPDNLNTFKGVLYHGLGQDLSRLRPVTEVE